SEFATPIDLISTSNTYASVNSEALNGAAIAAGLENDVFGTLDVRVRATVGNEAQEVFSDVITYSVKPYVTYPFRDLYLVGDATAAGWGNNNGNYPMFRDSDNVDLYHYTGYFSVGGFKLLEKKGQWAPLYGSDGTNLVPRPTESDPDPATIPITTAGYYTVTVNIADLTYSVDSYDASGATNYSTIAIIGDATPNNWDDPDTDMTQSTFDTHIWYITNQWLKAGKQMKFRANNNWDVNWGSPASYSGLGTQNGENINIGIPVDGNYDIWFNDLT